LSTERKADKEKNEKKGLLGGGITIPFVFGRGAASVEDEELSSTVTTSQKTLTVLIKFSGDQTVQEAKSHMSQF